MPYRIRVYFIFMMLYLLITCIFKGSCWKYISRSI